jgi:hypothetical protein
MQLPGNIFVSAYLLDKWETGVNGTALTLDQSPGFATLLLPLLTGFVVWAFRTAQFMLKKRVYFAGNGVRRLLN